RVLRGPTGLGTASLYPRRRETAPVSPGTPIPRWVRGRRVRYVIGDEPGQVNGMRWCAPDGPGTVVPVRPACAGRG
ncbi:hypothetical protein ACWD6I_29105, partial [Streptomyces sp. NPDC002454]